MTTPPPRADLSTLDAAAGRTVGDGVELGGRAPERLEFGRHEGAAVLLRAGRYRVERVLGEGAFGRVYAALDPELDRLVALKLLHADRAGEIARARLLREAQALAAVAHPNVVSVFDLGEVMDDDGDVHVYIAMELVEGQSLRDWLDAPDAADRSVDEVLAMLRQVAEGLAAVHGAGLVHRDLKPGNVLIGADGRARVADFGLARADAERLDTLETSRDDAATMSVDLLDVGQAVLTATGAVMGTPAYMAPEQFGGEPCTAPSDQFSFGVVLYEALYGERPFAGTTLPELRANVIQGLRRPRPRRPVVPARVVELLDRALQPEASDRLASMQAVLAILRSRRGRRRWPWALGVGVVGLAAGAAAFVGNPDSGGCANPRDALGWTSARARAVHDALAAPDLAFAADTAARVDARLTAFSDAWVSAYGEACALEDDAEHRDRAMACLARARRELSASASVLVEADADAIPRAVEMVAELPHPARCLGADVPEVEALPADPESAAAIETLREQLARVRALRRAGRYDDALTLAEDAAREADDLADEVLVAEAYDELGRVWAARRDLPRCEEALDRAYFVAQSIGDDRLAATIAAQLAGIVGGGLGRIEDGRAWARHAENHLARVDDPEPIRIELESFLGKLAAGEGDYAQARARLETALEMRQALDPDDPAIAAARVDVALTALMQGDLELARAELEQSVAETERTLGPEHPSLALALLNLGHARYEERDMDGAEEAYRRSLALVEASLGADDPLAASCNDALANIESDRGDVASAVERYRRALAVFEAQDDALLGDAATTRGNLGLALAREGRYDEAVTELGRAVDESERFYGSDHPETAGARGQLATVLLEADRPAEALEEATKAEAVLEKVVPDHPSLGRIDEHIGMALVALDRPDDAVDPLRRAVKRLAAAPGQGRSLASARFQLARALSAAGRDPDEVRRLVDEAEAGAKEAGDRGAALGREIAAWRSEHRSTPSR